MNSKDRGSLTPSRFLGFGLGLLASWSVGAQAQDLAPSATPEPEERHWYDNMQVGAFVDAYGALRSDDNGRHGAASTSAQSDANAAKGVANPGVTGAFGHDAYVEGSGFALAFAGLDVAYTGDEFGITTSLRFGPGVNRFYGADQGPFGIDNITQAYATWRPVKALTLDLGQFYTIYGAEVTESWRNQNYSRGALYYAMQPFWHTGLRANLRVHDTLAINAMIVNGVNTAFEGNKSPSLGTQLSYTPTPELQFALGYLTPLHPRNGDDETSPTKNFQDFLDAIATASFGGFKVVANADLNVYRPKGFHDRQTWWGVSVAPGYTVSRWFGVAARAEYLVDSANSQLAMAGARAPNYDPASGPVGPGQRVHLTTLTATLDFKPITGAAWIILRPEFRYDRASNEDFTRHGGRATRNFWSAHLGAVVTSMP